MDSKYFNLDCKKGITDILLPKKKFFIFFGPKKNNYFIEFNYKDAVSGAFALHKNQTVITTFPYFPNENEIRGLYPL